MNPVPWFASERLSREALEFRRSLLDAGVSVKNDTLNAVDALAKELRRAHLLDKIVYFNGFAGESPTGALYPQIDPNGYGVATNNNFVAGDYFERGDENSIQLDGVSDNVIVSHSDSLDYSEGQVLKLGAQISLTDASAAAQHIFFKDDQYRFTVESGVLQFAIPGVASATADSAFSFTDGEMTYVEVEYDTVANEVTYYKDGVAGDTVSFSSSPNASTNADLYIGSTLSQFFTGSISNPYVQIDSNAPVKVFAPGAKGDGSTKYLELPFSPDDIPATMNFDGVDDYVSIGNGSDLVLGSSDFSIEATILPTEVSGSSRTIYGRYNPSSNERSVIFRVTSAGALLLLTSSNGFSGTLETANTADGLIVAGNEYTVKVERSGTDATFYINGNVVASSGSVVSSIYNSTALAYIGAQGTGDADFFKGILREIKISKAGTDVVHLIGTGNKDADWEDQIGTNDGTVNGSPTENATGGLGAYVLAVGSSNESLIGVTDTNTVDDSFRLARFSGDDVGNYGDAATNVSSTTDGEGFLLVRRSSATDFKIFRNGAEGDSDTISDTVQTSSLNFFAFARNLNGSANAYASARLGAIIATDGTIPDAAQPTLSAIVTRFQERLGRV